MDSWLMDYWMGERSCEALTPSSHSGLFHRYPAPLYVPHIQSSVQGSIPPVTQRLGKRGVLEETSIAGVADLKHPIVVGT